MNYVKLTKYSKTQETILDSAEHLFACHGLHSTTLRAITSAADVNLAAVNYHFGTKELLIHAILLRRMTPLNNERQQQLDTVLSDAVAEGRQASVDEILRSFIEPTLNFSLKDGRHKDFMSIISTLMMNPDNEFRQLFTTIMKPLISKLFQALSDVLPALPPAILHMRLQFTLGTMVFAMRDIAIPIINHHKTLDIELMINEVTKFVSAGMEQP